MLSIKSVSLRKGKNNFLLNGISLELVKKEVSVFLGKSGSGKTSFLRCIAQLEREYEGEIIYNKKDLLKMIPKELCQIIGFVPQSFALFPHKNVLENCIGSPILRSIRKDEDLEEEALKVLTSLDMGKYLLSKPQELSGGQQQRVAIARAILLKPHFILFDEPTSALDPENIRLFEEVIQSLLKEGKGIVISTHDITFAEKIFDKAFFLEEGVIVENFERSKMKSEDLNLNRFYR